MRLISAHATQGAATRIPLPNTITWTLFGGKTDKPLNDQSDQQSASNNVPLAAPARPVLRRWKPGANQIRQRH